MKVANSRIKIDILSKSDIDFAHSLTEIEQWGYLKDDFQRLISWEPEGCFVARIDSNPVGIITSTSYDHYSFIGSLIISSSYRNQGIGEQLILHTLVYLRNKPVTTIELDGVIPAVPLYRRLGFKDKYLSLRFKRPASMADKSEINTKSNSTELQRIIEFDFQMTGLNRQRLLASYIDSLSDNIYLFEENRNVLAYAIVRPRQDGSFCIGPFLSKDSLSAEKMLSNILDDYGDRILSIGVPALNSEIVRFLVKNDFLYSQPSLRMYLGSQLDYENNIFGIFSAEKG